RTITLTDGLFSEDLGDTGASPAYAAIGDAIFADNAALYLRVTVGGEPLSPRKRLTAAPYALNAETLDGVDSASFLLGSNNLSDVGSAATARTNLGLGSLAVLSSVDISDNTNLVGGSSLTLTGDTLDVDDVFLFNSGDTAAGSYDFTGAVFAGTNALVFEGSSADDFETIFAITNPTVSDRTITFQNGTGTVAFTSDIPAGASLWEVGTNGTYEDDAAAIVGTDAAFTYVSSSGASDLRVGDDFEAVDDGFFGGDLVVGASTSATETLANVGFSLGGDDLFVAGLFGVEGNFYTDGSVLFGSDMTISAGSIETAAGGTLSINTTNNQNISAGTGNFDIGGHTAIGGTASVGTLDTLTLTESLACTSNCSSVLSSLTNTTAAFTTEAAGGKFTSASAVASGGSGALIGLSGTASTTGAVTYAGSMSGVRGKASASAASTWADVDGVLGEVTLNGVADIDSAVAVNGSLLYNASPGTLTGTLDLFYGNFAPSVAATMETFNGLELGLEGTAGTINNARGISVSLDSSGGLTLNSANTPSGINVTMNTAQASTDPTIYGVNVSATTGVDGTTAAYGVRSTASGGDTNYSGYFYGSLFQVDGNATPDTNNALATGAGDLYAVGDIEADGDLRLDGGDASVRTASGDSTLDVMTGDTAGFAIVSVLGSDGGGTAGNWQMYTASGAATITNGARSDLRWTIGGVISSDNDLMRLETDGTLFLDDAVGVGAADLAEAYVVADVALGAGDAVALTSAGDLVKASGTSGEQLFGIVSTSPGLMLGNGEDDVMSANERFIALSGRVPVKVNLEGGAIAPGDALTSSSVPGEAKKADDPGMILGFALASYTGAESPIEVFMSLQWNPVGKIVADGSAVGVNTDLVLSSLSDATPSATAVDSSSLILRGSAFDIAVSDRDFSLRTSVTNATDYRLSIKNAVDAEVAYVDQDGGFSVAGDVVVGDHLYPSDRGTPQTNRYIFYDGSAGSGGDFMRTNASGWATGSYDFAEMFPSSQNLEAGDIVVFASQKESVERSSLETRARIAGVVSTRPGFLAGDNKEGQYPIALAGRVPTRVSNEGGEIKIGDALTVSSASGVAMKAEDAGMILGFALENFSEASGKIIAFINATYWNGLPTSAKNTASGLGGASLSSLDLSGDLYIGSNDILNIGSMSGMGMLWEITTEGNLRTRGTLTTTIEAYNGDLVDTYATTSPEVYVTLAGTAELSGGKVAVDLVKEDPNFLSVVSNMAPLRILASPNAPIAVYVTNRKDGKFDIVQVGGSSSGVLVDWYVIGVRKDFEREEDLVIETPDVPKEPEVEETDLTPKVEEVEAVQEVEEMQEVEETLPVVIPSPAEESSPEGESDIEEEPEPIVEEVVSGRAGPGRAERAAGEVIEVVEVEETEEVQEIEEVVGEEPASDGESPEPEQIPSDSSHDDAGVASEGSEG
ncbi:TPA: hypothetical protein DDZ10_04055, partial [Candidatus Uhrbacteria bacterium]|nr:hypothetical protein [Candidatus Uhrbacteria bacterium]